MNVAALSTSCTLRLTGTALCLKLAGNKSLVTEPRAVGRALPPLCLSMPITCCQNLLDVIQSTLEYVAKCTTLHASLNQGWEPQPGARREAQYIHRWLAGYNDHF
jgi:hypothetical protein